MAESGTFTLARAGTASLVRSKNAFRDYLGVFRKDSYSSHRFGTWGSVLMTLLFMHPLKLGEFEWDLNSWSDKDILQWKKAHLAACNMTAIASTIIGQLALTALVLPDMGRTHWAARGFFVSAMVLGAFSVLAACFQQMSIGMLNQASEIRIWLSDRYTEIPPKELTYEYLNEKENAPKLPLRSSLAAQSLTRMPFALLTWAIVCYLLGFAIYLGFAWAYDIRDINQGENDNRNVLVVFLVASISTGILYATYSLMKATEQAGGSEDLAIDRKIPQNVIRKIKRSKALKTRQDNIQPLIALRDSLVKSGEDTAPEEKTIQTSLGPSSNSQRDTRLVLALEQAKNALTVCVDALTAKMEHQQLSMPNSQHSASQSSTM